MTAAGLLTATFLALALLGRELSRSLSRKAVWPPTGVVWALTAAFALLVVVRVVDYL